MEKSGKRSISRRDFLRIGGVTAAGLVAAACAAPAPAPAPAAPAATLAPATAAPAPTTAPGATQAPAATAATAATAVPAVVSKSVAKNDFEAMYEEAAAPFKGKDITLRMPVGGEGFWILWDKKIAPRFTELTGIKTQFESANYEQVYEKTFLDLGAKSGTYDVFDLNFTWFGQFMATDGLAPLQPYIDNPKMPKVDTAGYIPALLDTYGKWEGKLYGLPLIADAMIFPYNMQHFKDAGLDPNAPPKTWDDVYKFGKQLTKADRYGFALMGGRQIQAMCSYAAIFFGLAHKGFYNDDGTSAFASPEGQQAMDIFAVQLPEIAPGAATTWDISQASEAVAQGQCSMEIQWPGILQSLVDPKAKVAGQMGYAAPPGGTALGGHGCGVSNYSKNKDAAYLFTAYTTAPEIQKQYVADGYAISWQSLFSDPEVQKANPYIKPFGDALAAGIGWPKTEETPQVFDIMVKYISSAVTKEMKTKDALDAMNKEINALRKDKGFIK
jgi:multiple sugar transport system substrate-binding protein